MKTRKAIPSRLPADEQALLAMPERAYMNEDQRAFFRDRLRRLRDELISNVGMTSSHLRQAEVATDPNDRATQEEEQAIELRTRDRERKLMKKIDRALAMIDEGTYGWCEETGEPIGLQRLLARPTATLCVEAQERREKRERVYGH
ncbi:MAG: RNA polymerase-binding protein DksA [Burkholderiales bacterium]|nr:RNA polymerase-binding protein DksA [Burkholderiales bacterium]